MAHRTPTGDRPLIVRSPHCTHGGSCRPNAEEQKAAGWHRQEIRRTRGQGAGEQCRAPAAIEVEQLAQLRAEAGRVERDLGVGESPVIPLPPPAPAPLPLVGVSTAMERERQRYDSPVNGEAGATL